jgi:multiple sugar transport system substrate-binding protein
VNRRALALLALLLALAMTIAACGSDDDGGGGGGAGGEQAVNEETGVTEGAKTIDVASMENASGNVTVCTGKDTAGEKSKGIKDFNEQFPDLKAKLLEFPTSADEQRNQFVQRQQAKSDDCDVFVSDVIWTAEFAGQKWLLDLTPYVETRQDEFIPSTLETAKYDGKYWGVPRSTNAGFLFYRTDQVQQVPDTWQAVYEEAATNDGIVYQGNRYEGLTVNFLELAFAAGGSVLNEDGTEATIDSPENLEALQFMVDGLKNGAVPKATTTYMEEEARRAFEAGRATFMRNWPYAYGLGQESKQKGKFEIGRAHV